MTPGPWNTEKAVGRLGSACPGRGFKAGRPHGRVRTRASWVSVGACCKEERPPGLQASVGSGQPDREGPARLGLLALCQRRAPHVSAWVSLPPDRRATGHLFHFPSCIAPRSHGQWGPEPAALCSSDSGTPSMAPTGGRVSDAHGGGSLWSKEGRVHLTRVLYSASAPLRAATSGQGSSLARACPAFPTPKAAKTLGQPAPLFT